MFVRGGNCVRMDMGKVLSNKMVTFTDAFCCMSKHVLLVWYSLFGDFLSVVQLFILSEFSFIKTM